MSDEPTTAKATGAPGWVPPFGPNTGSGRRYRILSLDGGPSTPNYLRILRAIEVQRPGFLDQVDMFAGTSDGAWAALLLASRPTTMTGLQAIDAAIAFNESVVDSMRPGLFGLLRLASGVSSALDNTALEAFLTKSYGLGPSGEPIKLGELNRDVVLVTFRLGEQPVKPGARLFHNLARNDNGTQVAKMRFPQNARDDLQQTAAEVALRSGAFPIMLPVRAGFADGGLFANNPALCGLTQLLEYREPLGVTEISNIVMMSMGADEAELGGGFLQGAVQRGVDLRWGWAPWLVMPWSPLLLLDAITVASGRGVSFQAKQLLGPAFIRVAQPMRESIGREFLRLMAGRTDELFREADATSKAWAEGSDGIGYYPSVSDTLDWVDRIWLDIGDGNGAIPGQQVPAAP